MLSRRFDWWISTYDPVEFAAFVTLRPTLRVLVLTSTVLAKVFGSLRSDVGEELHLHSAQWLPCKHQRDKSLFSLIFKKEGLGEEGRCNHANADRLIG